MRPKSLVVVAALALFGLGLAACGSDEPDTAAGGGDAEATVQITLQEWAVIAEPASIAAGEVTFEITNVGEETHEFVVFDTDLGALDLPTAEDGSVDEEGAEGLVVVDEVEDIPAGETAELTVDLEAGQYVLVCNILETEEQMEEMEMEMMDPSHFQNGMRVEFTVD